MALHHRLHHFLQLPQCLIRLGASSQRQLAVERSSLLMSFDGLLSRRLNPATMLVDERHHLLARHPDGYRHMHIAILNDAHRQSACTPVCYFYRHFSVALQYWTANLGIILEIRSLSGQKITSQLFVSTKHHRPFYRICICCWPK